MTANHDLERRLADYYTGEAPQRAPDRVLAATFAAIDSTTQRRVLIRVPFRRMSTATRLALAATLLIAAAAIGLALAGNRPPVPPPLTWTQDSLVEDWPAPVRPEPPGGGRIVTMNLADDARWDSSRAMWDSFEFPDPVGEVVRAGAPWVDIKEVGLSPGTVTAIGLELADDVPRPQAHPANKWIAYGFVQDTNGDGAADVRIGIDNLPVSEHRAWNTDLASGETKSAVGPPYGSVGTVQDGGAAGRVSLDTYYPGEGDQSGNRASLRYMLTFEELTRHGSYAFYAWASMIEDGRVVATDYAPDAGWLVAGADPGLPLVGTTWTIEREIPSRSITVVMWLIFTADGQLSLELCQRGDATVRITPDTMRVTDLALSGDACIAEITEMEAEILDVLSADALSYTVDAGILELRAGSNVLRFVGSSDPPPGF
jgi:hypothetical protein